MIYTPRPHFLPFHLRRQRWACIVAHRRAGKTVAAVNELITRALATRKENARYGYLAPYRGQAKMIAWDYLKRYSLPVAAKTSESELSVDLFNDSRIRLFGADNPDALRGGYLDGVILDEPSDMRPSVWPEIVRPCLADRLGWAAFIGTSKGHNAFYEIHEHARVSQEWYWALLKASETGILPPEEIADMRKAMTEDQAAQELECSFEAAIQGAIYAKELAAAREAKRIGRAPYDPALQVHTAWDLGVGDATAIWFIQTLGQEARLIDYYEASGEGLPHYAKVLQDRGYVYGRHCAPHDIAVRELGSGRSRIEVAASLGIKFETAPNVPLEDGIHAARLWMARCWFDETKCKAGLEALQHYRWDYNERLGEFKTRPVHDWASHCFTGDTEVLTRYGTCQIMNLPKQGEVLTPCGWKPYRDPRVTRRNAPLVAVTFADGLTVRCTPDHLFLTASGWISASDLRPDSLIQSTLTLSSSILTAAYIERGQRSATSRAAARRFTVPYGRWRLVQSLKDATSIIATTIRRTIDLQTLNVCQPAYIYPRTGREPSAARQSTSRSTLDGELLSGINPRKGDCGTAGTPRAQRGGLSGGARSGLVRIAESSLWRSFARAVMRKSFAGKPAKPLLIESVKPLQTPENVWCLTVPDGECFSLANGAVVHNCADSFRYAALALKDKPQKVKREARPQYLGPGAWMR